MAGPWVSRNALSTSWKPGLCSAPVGLGGNEGYAATSGRRPWEAPQGASVVCFYPVTAVTEAQTLKMTQLCVNKG